MAGLMTECEECGTGIHKGLCSECAERISESYDEERKRADQAEAELAVTNKLLDGRTKVLKAIPECDDHGDECVPHALEWIARAKRALMALVDEHKGEQECPYCHNFNAEGNIIHEVDCPIELAKNCQFDAT